MSFEIASFIAPLPFVLFGYIASKYGVNNLLKTWRSKSWPTTIGSISYSEVHKKISRSSGGAGYEYKPRVRYEYMTNDKILSSNQIFFGEYASSNKSEIESLLSKYPIGQDVTVFFNPQKPEEAILESKISKGTVLSLFAGIVFVGVAVIIHIVFQDLTNHK